VKVPQMVEAQSGYVRVEVDCALICDYATVREDLLHILGGGVSRLMRPVYPDPFAAGLALRILLHPTELDAEHTVKIQLVDSDGATVAELTSTFSVPQEQRASLETGEELAVNMPLNLPMVAIPKRGDFAFEILIAGHHKRSVPFKAKVAPLPGLPLGDSGPPS
jgi:hypothetical protein